MGYKKVVTYMRIIVAIDHFKNGGAERVASVIINRLCVEHEVHVVVMDKEINYPLAFEHISIHVINYSVSSKVARVWSKIRNYRKIISDVKADLVLSFANFMSIYTAAALLGNGRKKTTVIMSERTDPRREPIGFVARYLRDLAYNSADFLVCQTPWVMDYFTKYIQAKCVVIPNPISPNLPKWNGFTSKVIMTACRFVEQKNLPLLLHAFKRLHSIHQDLHLVIWGDGELRSELSAWITSNGMDEYIEMPGFTRNAISEMEHSYMYVSSSDYEGISNSMLEALGVGIPTVCTDCPVGGADMFIDNGKNGLLVPVGDENALFEAMKKMVEDRNFALSCSKSSRSINDSIHVERVVNKWLELIK